MNGRNCNAQYGGIVPPSKWKSQSLIGKVIASLQRPLEAPVPIETWGRTSRCACAVISALELRMHIGWSSLKNKLFKRYLSIRNNIHGAVHFRDCCRFEICNLIVSSASSFWDFRIPPFIYIALGLVWAECPEALQIWPPSERTFLERDFGLLRVKDERRSAKIKPCPLLNILFQLEICHLYWNIVGSNFKCCSIKINMADYLQLTQGGVSANTAVSVNSRGWGL